MIIVHDENLKLQHVIYEHPPTYHEVIDAQGHAWIHTKHQISLEEIQLSRHPETNALQLHRERPGHLAELVEHDDKQSLAVKLAARAKALEEAKRRQEELERLHPPVAPVRAPEFGYMWIARI